MTSTLEARLLEIDSAVREGMDKREALRKAYDTIAPDVLKHGAGEEALTKTVPERVLVEAWKLGWVRRPAKPETDLNPRRSAARRVWLPDARGWLLVKERTVLRQGTDWDWHEYLRRTTQEPARRQPETIAIAGESIPLEWWERTWLPIFAGRVQAWRAKLLAGKAEAGGEKDRTYPRRAKWLRDALAERGWSISKLADEADVDRRTIRRVLDGRPVSARILEYIVDGLNSHPRVAKTSVEEVPDD